MTNFFKYSLHFWMKDWIISDHFYDKWKMTLEWKFPFILYFLYFDGSPKFPAGDLQQWKLERSTAVCPGQVQADPAPSYQRDDRGGRHQPRGQWAVPVQRSPQSTLY